MKYVLFDIDGHRRARRRDREEDGIGGASGMEKIGWSPETSACRS